MERVEELSVYWLKNRIAGFLVCTALIAGLTPSGARAESLDFNFAQGDHGFIAGFVDYPVGEETFHELESGFRPLPPGLGQATSLFISGNNHSDDLFMFYKRHVTGLLPGTVYRLGFDLQFATDADFGSIGIGGSPAHSVFVKAGASALEPSQTLLEGFYRLTVDKGAQSDAGSAALVIGDVSKPEGAPDGFQFVTRTSAMSFLEATTSPTGDLWLFFGTDSGYEGTTSLYYTNFNVTLEPIPEPTTAALGILAMLIAAAAFARKIPGRKLKPQGTATAARLRSKYRVPST